MSATNGTFQRATSLQYYFADINPMTNLDRETEQALGRRIQKGDREALNKLVQSNLHFVICVAKKYQNLGLAFEDLISEGNIGLIEAAGRFDPERGIKFITYAVWWIRRSIVQALTNTAHLVRVPKYKVRELFVFRQDCRRLKETLEREPTSDEISENTGKSLDEINDLLLLSGREIAHEELYADTAGGDRHPRGFTCEVEEVLFRDEEREQVRAGLERLNRRQRLVLEKRFGIDGERMTLEEVGKLIGLTRERVRQIELQAKKAFREAFAEVGVPSATTSTDETVAEAATLRTDRVMAKDLSGATLQKCRRGPRVRASRPPAATAPKRADFETAPVAAAVTSLQYAVV